jgi:endonuclease YncB( thermonuclease family)
MVYFNDGDTFKILDGKHRGLRARVTGLNSLETYGPVHQWQNSDADYLFTIAKRATEMVQTGSWTCLLEGGADGYGRLLARCDDLALALIKDGLAHAYSIDEKPALRIYLTAQKEAQAKGLGMWKSGVPNFIITSLHSANESDLPPYNRVISTSDGHSEKWQHERNYETCEKVCQPDEPSCMVYVPIDQRYGSSRASCLR